MVTLASPSNNASPEHVLRQRLNDPNWNPADDEYDISPSNQSFELDTKFKDHYGYSDGTSMAHSTAGYISDYDTESRFSGSRLNMKSSSVDVNFEDDSPYAEVRAVIPNTDDPMMPVSTFRAFFLGSILCVIIAVSNQVFSYRLPPLVLTAVSLQLFAFPLGNALHKILPATKFRTFGYSWSLNPGPFNIKEHVVIGFMVNVGYQSTYATEIIAAQKLIFGQDTSFLYQILLCGSTTFIGFGLIGLVRQHLVRPAAMLWPASLVTAAIYNTLHRRFEQIPGKKAMSPFKFFFIVVACSCVWYLLPGYLFTALSMFNWVCWIAPNNVVVNQVFGYSSGLGLGFLTFDWAQISWFGSPLATPWWAQVNIFGGYSVFWVLTVILYYTNRCFFAYLPIATLTPFDRTGLPYDMSQIIVNGTFDEGLYQQYSPVYFSVSYILGFSSIFASLSAVVVHTFLWYRRDIVHHMRFSTVEYHDVHSRLMSVYKEVPSYWYGAISVLALIAAIITIEVYHTELPIWTLVVLIVICSIFVLPVGYVLALSNQTVEAQVLGEMICGYMIPGKLVAGMIFKAYFWNCIQTPLAVANMLKLGHYMKIPPRVTFVSLVLAYALTILGTVSVQVYILGNIPDVCSPDQPNNWVCPSLSTFSDAALLWNGIGPQRLFSSGKIYGLFMLFFLVGGLLPIPFYFLAKRSPTSFWRFVNIPVALGAIIQSPPATAINFTSWFMVGTFFEYYVRRRHFNWWSRYNYILSGGLDTGTAISFLIIFFAFQIPNGTGINVNWWGNTVWQQTLDAAGVPLYSLPPNGTFGFQTWS